MRHDPAPGELGLIERFCNTATHLWRQDAFSTVSGANTWLAQNGFPAVPGDRQRKELVEAREAIRAFLVDRSSDNARRRLNEFALASLGPPQIGPGGTIAFRQPGHAVSSPVISAALSALLSRGLSAAGERLKACAASDCHYVFYDHSRSKTGTWCDMNICGARHKMRSYRSRRVAGSGD